MYFQDEFHSYGIIIECFNKIGKQVDIHLQENHHIISITAPVQYMLCDRS